MTTLERSDQLPKPAHIHPYAMLGAGKLVSTIWKSGNEQAGWRYCFNLFRMSSRGRVGQKFSPTDVLSLVKLARVLAAELATDGCLATAQRSELARLAAVLDHVIQPED